MLERIPLTYYALSGLFNFITSFTLSVFVFSKNPRSRTNQTFSFWTFTVAGWGLSYFLWLTAGKSYLAEFYLRTLMLFVIFIPSTFTHFILTFLKVDYGKRINVCNYLISLFLGLTVYTRLFARDIGPFLVFPYWLKPKFPFFIHSIHFFTNIIYCHFLMLRAIKHYSGILKNQVLYIFIGPAIGFSAGAINYLTWYRVPIPPFLNSLVSISVAFVSYAIIKHRLMDIKVAVTRAGIFAIVYVLVLGIPFGLAGGGRPWLISVFGQGWFWIPMVILLGLATSGPFIYLFLQRRAEAILLKEQRRYQETLRKLSATLTLVKDLNRLLKLVVLRGARAVKVDFACVYLANENKLIQKYPYTIKGFFPDFPKELSFNSSLVRYITSKRKPIFAEELSTLNDSFNLKTGLIVPSFVRKRLLGFLVLGPKSSGTIYNEADANMFGILANQLALAIENSQFIDEHERTQAELFSRERMASLGTMAGGMTHQINNRFNAISMATSDTIDTLKFIDPNSCSQEAKEYLQQIKHALTRIQENALRGGKLVNDFLNFSQPDRLQKEAKIFNLPEPLERGIEMARIKTAFSQDTIQKEIQESPLLIRGSFEMIQDMYFNITDNARDALDKRDKAIQKKELPQPESGYKGKITIKMHREDSFAVTKIQDNGIGMTKEQLGKLFTPFFTTKATAIKGTGLGFFVIYKIIEAHEGTIEVESEYGKGTTFTIKLPLAKEGEENNES